jgi:endonuclease/exonuclease/phosphatase family metal-dependent hydrolase
MRVITLNTWKGDGAYTQRLAAMAAGLHALAPDIVALQEALAAPAAGHDTAAHLATALGLDAATLPLRRKPRTVEGRVIDSTSGLVVLSRWPIRAQRAVPLTSDLRDGERAALIVEVAAPRRPISIACVHFTHLANADELRRREWQEVQAAVAGCQTVIVAGDFNAPIEIFALGGFTDSRQACGAAAAPTYVDATSAVCIDHVLCRGLTATGWRAALGEAPPGCDVCASDHRAVVVDFDL